MKHYIVSIIDCIDSYEFDMNILTTSDDDHIEEKTNMIAKNWYGEGSVESEEGEFENEIGDVTTYVSKYKEISETTYNELKHFIGEL